MNREFSNPFIGHEIKNNLAILKGSLQLFQYESGFRISPDLMQRMEKALNRIGTSADALMATRGQNEERDTIIDVSEIMKSCIQLYFPDSKFKFKIEKSNCKEALVRGDGPIMEQVFLNLFMNALDAGAENIEVRVVVERGFVIISIEDDGMGCPASVLKNLFVPGFTTKRARAGNGYGLFISKTTVEKYQGRIQVIGKNQLNEHAHGLIFTMTFPDTVATAGSAKIMCHG